MPTPAPVTSATRPCKLCCVIVLPRRPCDTEKNVRLLTGRVSHPMFYVGGVLPMRPPHVPAVRPSPSSPFSAEAFTGSRPYTLLGSSTKANHPRGWDAKPWVLNKDRQVSERFSPPRNQPAGIVCSRVAVTLSERLPHFLFPQRSFLQD